MTVDHALALRFRYHLRGPANLDLLLAGEGFGVARQPLAGRLRAAIIDRQIALADRFGPLAAPETRVQLAHTLGHHFLRHGPHLCLAPAGPRTATERAADLFAVHLLLPPNELATLLAQGGAVPQIARHFCVPRGYVEEWLPYLLEESPFARRALAQQVASS